MEITGTGTISEVIPGKKYRLRHNIGKDPITGKYLKSSWKIVYCTKREAKHELELYRQELLQKEYERLHPKSVKKIPTLKEYGQEYIEVRKETKNLSENTIKKDCLEIGYITTLFGEYPMNELTSRTINKRLASYKKANDCSLGKINRIAKMLKTLYRRAVIEGIIEYRENPCFGINLDKPDPPQRRSLSMEEFNRLETIVNNSPITAHMTCIKLGLATGMRKGEVLGLLWKYIDFDEGRIHVVQQYTQDGKLKPPKSRSGYRTIYIDPDTLEYLKKWKTIQQIALKQFGLIQAGETPVAMKEDGTIFDPRAFSRWFRDFCVNNELGTYENTEDYWDNQGDYDGWHRKRKSGYKGLCFHELRHTQATLLIGNGCDIKTVQHRLGHADVETTLNTYSHTIDANDIAAANIIAGLKR